ncbi:MAG: reverse transcriptase domain-containing protein [Candidatus Nanoarchaeia archaeon]|nr:reverse transcriptase domain-containing protein [Candidatus Nanoarchaeia archaeon]
MQENLYDKMCSYANLEHAFKKARKGKTLKDYVIMFEENLTENLLKLQKELILQTYKPKPLETFIIRDPKTRKISKSDFRDRVIHHAICNIIEPKIDKKFIFDSYANRKGKGGLNAIKRFNYFKTKVSNNFTRICFVLKADIKSYFDNVNHEILINILKKYFDDENIINLIKLILKNHKTIEKGKGMPLGNLTSQFFANVYLNELDQFIKHKLKIKYYIRYVDDFVILGKNKNKLIEYKQKIDLFLKQELVLKLHPDKSKILDLNNGINFLGFRIFPHHILLAKRNLRKFKNSLIKLREKYLIKKIDRENIVEKLEGWLAYSSHANTFKLRKKVISKFNQMFPIEIDEKINIIKKHQNFSQKIENNKFLFTEQKTLQLFKNKLSAKEIAEKRNLMEGTINKHLCVLVSNHQIKLKEILPTWKVKLILENIGFEKSIQKIYEKINNCEISLDDISLVLANVEGKRKKKTIFYYVSWYKKVNCRRKCYYNKKQIEICNLKFQKLVNFASHMEFTKKEFLVFINNKTTICELDKKIKNKFMSWNEFKINEKLSQPK